MPTCRVLIAFTGFVLLVCGCRTPATLSTLRGSSPPVVNPTPTVMGLLGAAVADAPPRRGAMTAHEPASTGLAVEFRPAFSATNTPEAPNPEPASVGEEIALPTSTATQPVVDYVEAVVYDDELMPQWSLAQSSSVDFDPYDTSHWFIKIDPLHGVDSGAVSVAVTPLAGFGTLFFTLQPDADVTYPREQTLGISLWINSGGAIMDTDDLSVSVVGSNELAYWSADDYSVFPESNASFSETRLYYLGLNRAIPPNTWVRIVVWLDDLQFDPLYENVTGFYLKNDSDFKTTFYVDNVALLLTPGAEQQTAPNR